MKTQSELYRELPAVDEILRRPEVAALVAQDGQAAVGDACRAVLSRLRDEISAGTLDAHKLSLALSGIQPAIQNELSRALGYSMVTVINATGVILHTNLGRAPLGEAVLDHIRETAGEYSNLEFDLESGERGKRDTHVDRLFQKLLSDDGPELRSAGRARTTVPTQAFTQAIEATAAPSLSTPAISTIVVNNNAAAVLLALNTLAEGDEVIVSRGELVEIGGSFRIPDVMGKSGAILREVGTTNRTRIGDYEGAMNEHTRLLLRVHRSNFEITGFTEQPTIGELVRLAKKHNLSLVEDLGSGALVDLSSFGITGEPSVLDRLHAGVDVVTYSGDKLLGGPQSGMITGRDDLIKKMRRNSLFRALRADKLTSAALEATLLAYVKHDYDSLPVLRMMGLSKSEIGKRAEAIASGLDWKKLRAELIDGESLLGGGSAPSAALPSKLLAITCDSLSANELADRLRTSGPAVVSRVDEGRVLLDLRTVFPEQDEVLRRVLARIAET